MKNLLIADDHAMVRQVLRNAFREAGFHVVAEAASAQEAVTRAQASTPDVAILDIAMPGDFLQAIHELKRLEQPPKVLVLTASDDERLSILAIRAGADGFLRKTEPAQELVAAVERLAAGGKYVSAELACRLATSDGGPADHEQLSGRELQVLTLLGSARTVTEIAEELGLSFKTVSTYRTRLLEKMGFENNTDIIRYCLEAGLDAGT